jgi:hypothetical protein
MPLKMRHQERLQEIGMAALGIIAVAGIITAAAVAPAVLGALRPFVRRSRPLYRSDVDRALKRWVWSDAGPKRDVEAALDDVSAGRVSPYQAAQGILARLQGSVT